MSRITFIARMNVKDGHESRFLQLMNELADYVRDHEPGTVQYQLVRFEKPGQYGVIEGFRDPSAAEIHSKSARLAQLAPLISDCLIGTWEIENFELLRG